MSYYEYRVVPAPKEVPRAKGVKGVAALFALGLEESLNAEGQDSWEYQRSETLTVSSKQGLFRKTVTETVTVMIYRRWVDTVEATVVREETGEAWTSSFEPVRDEPRTPEAPAAGSSQNHGDAAPARPRPDDADIPSEGNNAHPSRGTSTLSASRRPDGALRPVPGPARD